MRWDRVYCIVVSTHTNAYTRLQSSAATTTMHARDIERGQLSE